MKLSVEGKAIGSLSKSDASIDPRILDSARREFLARGFEGASLQSICADAGVTTGALYKRYKGKADLFEAVVAPTLADIRALEEEAKRRDYALMDDKNLRELWALSEDIHRQWMIYFYERYEGMRLLLCCAEGTAYANFLHDFVARNTALCMEFVNEARRRDLPPTSCTSCSRRTGPPCSSPSSTGSPWKRRSDTASASPGSSIGRWCSASNMR